MLGGTVSGLNSVGEGFIFGYSPPLLDKIETIEDTSFSSVDGVNKLEFTKYMTLNEKVDNFLTLIFVQDYILRILT